MSIDEIITRLDAHATLLDSAYEPYLGYAHRCRTVVALREVIALLRTHPEAQPNEPLTLEELEKMDGRPVWVESPNVDRKHSGRWGIVDCVIVPNKTLFLQGDYPCHDYGTVWVAYRRPPKEDQR